jgi:phosphopantothenoylcysteine decarboxylase/phosphopantothenate--cysteine ligase
MSKIACGIDDTTATSIVSTAFGSKIPITIVPAMHESMYNHPVVTENIKKLKALGTEFVGPRIEEGKAKIAETKDIADAVIRRLARQDLSGLKILVTAGSTVEHIDPIRVITNVSSGKMGVAIAEEAISRGAEVTLVYGVGTATSPRNAHVISVRTTEQMYNAVVSELKSQRYDAVIAAAAPADWTIEKPHSHKISTHELHLLSLKLRPTKKIIDYVKKVSPETFLVAFRAEYKQSDRDLIEKAHRRLLEAKADLIVVNDVYKEGVGFESDTNEIFIVDNKKNIVHVPLSPKREVAKKILNVASEKIKLK